MITFGKMAGGEAIPREGMLVLLLVIDVNDDDMIDEWYLKQNLIL
jgi:hypothetical protein